MPIKSNITDVSSGLKAEVDNSDGAEKKALVVATRPLKTYDNVIKPFANPDYGIDMNQNTAAGGIPEEVHDGNDTSLWTGSNVVGTNVDFFSTAMAYEGTQSVEVDGSDVDDVFQFAKGSNLDCSGYVSITMWINVDRYWASGDIIQLYGWNTAAGTQIGDAVDLSSYFDYSSYDTWHKLNIPLSDMGDLANSGTLDALRFRIAVVDFKGPEFYIDQIEFEETGTPIEYKVSPDKGTWLHVSGIQIIMADDYTGTLADSTMPKLPYDGFLGVSTLDIGITYKRVQAGEVILSANSKHLLDVMTFGNAEIASCGSDGTNSWAVVKMTFTEPVVLKAESLDYISFVINDDMSNLLQFKAIANAKVEER